MYIQCSSVRIFSVSLKKEKKKKMSSDPPASPPLIIGVQDGGHTEGEPLTLSCSVTGGQPPVTVINFWYGQASGDSSDTTATVNGVIILTRSVTFDRLDSTMNGTVCQCSALWRQRPSLYTQTSTVTITLIGVYYYTGII